MTRLVGYGCSFTAGAELADHDMLGCDIETIDNLKRQGLVWDEIWKKLGHDVDPFADFHDLFRTVKLEEIPNLKEGEDICRSRSWVRYLAELRGHDRYKNHAQGGTSLTTAIYFLETDIINGWVNPDEDEIIVQVPHIYRWMTFDIDGNFSQIRPENIFESMIKFKQEHDNNFMVSESAYLVNEMNYWNLTWRYYQQLKHLHNMGVKFFFIESPPLRMRDQVVSDVDISQKAHEYVREDFEKYWNWIDSNAIDTKPVWQNWTRSKRHGNNHYFERTQIDIARYLNDKLGN